jgi:hypothetical protein
LLAKQLVYCGLLGAEQRRPRYVERVAHSAQAFGRSEDPSLLCDRSLLSYPQQRSGFPRHSVDGLRGVLAIFVTNGFRGESHVALLKMGAEAPVGLDVLEQDPAFDAEHCRNDDEFHDAS